MCEQERLITFHYCYDSTLAVFAYYCAHLKITGRGIVPMRGAFIYHCPILNGCIRSRYLTLSMFEPMAAMFPKVAAVCLVLPYISIYSLDAYTLFAMLTQPSHNLCRRSLFSRHFQSYEVAYLKCQITVVLQSASAVCGFYLRLFTVVASLTAVSPDFSTER